MFLRLLPPEFNLRRISTASFKAKEPFKEAISKLFLEKSWILLVRGYTSKVQIFIHCSNFLNHYNFLNVYKLNLKKVNKFDIVEKPHPRILK